jgi:YggT family protein
VFPDVSSQATPATLFIQLASAAESDEARVAVASTYNLVNELASSDPLDPETAKTIAGFLGPFFSLATIAFIVRIVMTWYPSVPYTKLPWVVAYVPTEPLLKPTRSLVPPVGGVDVSPIIWVMAISFMNEILLGKQGLLILLSNKQMMG